MNIEAIRKAVQKHHGGFESASSQEIMALWIRLDKDTQRNYLEGEKSNAGNRRAGNIKDRTKLS